MMQLSENICAAVPVLRCYRVGFSFPITCERAAPCTSCSPLVFPSQFYGLQKFCTEMSAWLQSRAFRVWIPMSMGRVVQPPYVTEMRLPRTPSFRKENMKKMQCNISKPGRSLLPSLLPCFLLTDHSTSKPRMLCLVFFVCFSLPSSCAINSLLSLLWCFMLSRWANKIMM